MGLTSDQLLIVWHSRTGASKAMAQAAAHGAARASAAGAQLLAAEAVEADALRAAPGYLFVCPENLASMSGAMKEMFDRTYYDVLGQIEGRPYASLIAAGSDGAGAQRQLERIATGWRLKRVAEAEIIHFNAQTPAAIMAAKRLSAKDAQRCHDLGAALAAGLEQGIF